MSYIATRKQTEGGTRKPTGHTTEQWYREQMDRPELDRSEPSRRAGTADHEVLPFKEPREGITEHDAPEDAQVARAAALCADASAPRNQLRRKHTLHVPSRGG